MLKFIITCDKIRTLCNRKIINDWLCNTYIKFFFCRDGSRAERVFRVLNLQDNDKSELTDIVCLAIRFYLNAWYTKQESNKLTDYNTFTFYPRKVIWICFFLQGIKNLTDFDSSAFCKVHL